MNNLTEFVFTVFYVQILSYFRLGSKRFRGFYALFAD